MKYQWHTETTHHVRKVLALILLLAMSTVSGVYGQPILVQPPDGGTGLSNPILLDWSSVSGASGYDYQVYEGSTLVTANSNGPITSSYVRVNLGFEKTYRWRTRARVLPQNNPWSDYWTFTTAAEPVPTGVTATATSDTSARVTWTNPSGTIDAIQIYDSDSGAAFQFGENVPANLNSAERTGLVADHNYCFKVRVQMHGQWSALSTDEGCVSLVPPPVPPPTGITATPTSQTSARVTWMNPSGTIDAIQIYDSDNGAAYQFGENVPPNLNSAERTGLVASDPYCFKVRVQIGGRWSALSDAACTTLPVTPAPTRVTATATSDTSAQVAWVNSSGTIDAIQIYDSDNGGTYHFGENVPSNLNSAERTDLTCGDPYCFKVRVRMNGVWSALSSNAACVQLPSVGTVLAPTGVSASLVTSTSAGVSWDDPPGTIQAIQIYDSHNGGPFVLGENVPTDRQSAVRDNLVAGDPYCFKVRVQIGGLWSPLSTSLDFHEKEFD